jgi:hypothetical protein
MLHTSSVVQPSESRRVTTSRWLGGARTRSVRSGRTIWHLTYFGMRGLVGVNATDCRVVRSSGHAVSVRMPCAADRATRPRAESLLFGKLPPVWVRGGEGRVVLGGDELARDNLSELICGPDVMRQPGMT